MFMSREIASQTIVRDSDWVAPGCKVGMATVMWCGDYYDVEDISAWSIIQKFEKDPGSQTDIKEVVVPKAWEILAEFKVR